MRSLLLVCCLLVSGLTSADEDWLQQASTALERELNLNPALLLELDRLDVKAFYRERDYRPVWFDEFGRVARAYELILSLRRVGDEGLNPEEYFLDQIQQFDNTAELDELVSLELWLTAALTRYANDVYSGRVDPYMVDVDWFIPNARLDNAALLQSVAERDSILEVLAELFPGQAGYRALRQQLKRYRAIALRGGWDKLTGWTELGPGMRGEAVVSLRKRLQLEGDLDAATASDSKRFDADLSRALKRYQRRHGLSRSGRLDSATRQALNVSVEQRIAQIRLNLERWRWLPRDLGERYIAVNMTGFELALMQDNEVELSMPVIIGKPFRETPALSGVISNLEYNPYWTIPKRVMWEKFIPHQIEDPDYLVKRSIRVFRGWANPVEVDPRTIDWTRLDPKNNSPYWMRQDPGPGNALGRAKFIFSNPYSIYLHGTPEKHLFNREVRTFSLGCIRVKEPAKLAVSLQQGMADDLETQVQRKINSGKNEKVILRRAVPIYLMYWTAWVDADGVLNFRDDIYERDALLNQRLAQL